MHPIRRYLLLLPLLALVASAQSGGRSTPPRPLAMPSPDYPAVLEDTGLDGTAMMEFTVGADGSVLNPTVQSADHPAFGEAALSVLSSWRFEAATRDGQPVSQKVALPFKFAAPAEQKINAAVGRKVFVDLEAEPIPADQYRGSQAPLNRPPLAIPSELVAAGEEQVVPVEFVLTPQGRPVNPVVVGEVDSRLAAAALLHVAGLVYEPPTKDGQPVHVKLTREVRFSPPRSAE